MNTYIIETTTDQQWEVCGGTYIVNALTKKEALGFVKDKIGGDAIVSFKKLDRRKKGLRLEQHPMVE